MLNVVMLASDLGPSRAGRQVSLIAPALPRDRFRVAVVQLGAAGELADGLTHAGVPLTSVPVRGALDVAGLRRVRRAVADAAPDVVHAWGPAAARAARLTTTPDRDGGNRPRLVLSAAADPGPGLLGWVTARRLRLADRVAAASWSDGERYRQLGVEAARLTRVPPAVVPPDGPTPDGDEFRRSLKLPQDSRLLFAGGRFDTVAGLKDAVWAFDVLKYDVPDLFLVLFGDGAGRADVEQFGRALGFDNWRVRFAGVRPDLPSLMRLASAVWVTHGRGGVTTTLEAMAAGVPVLGWKTPDLTDVIDYGETGYLMDPGDKVELAAKTRALLADPQATRRLGECGRRRAADRFPLSRAVDQLARIYGELSGE